MSVVGSQWPVISVAPVLGPEIPETTETHCPADHCVESTHQILTFANSDLQLLTKRNLMT